MRETINASGAIADDDIINFNPAVFNAERNRPLCGTQLMIVTSGNVKTTRINSFGYYRFETVKVGQTVIISIRHKRYQFAPQVVAVNEQIDDLNIAAQNGGNILQW